MFHCVQCRKALERVETPEGRLWDCPNCRGRFCSYAQVRRLVPRDVANSLWQSARKPDGRAGPTCPSCILPMTAVRPQPAEDLPWLDVCTRCHMVWFDPGEFEMLPALPPEPEAEEPEAVRQAAAVMQVMLDKERLEREPAAAWPDASWRALPGLLGFPVEMDAPVLRRWPVVTIGLALALVVIGLLTLFGDAEAAAQRFGFIPAEAARLGGLTFLTAFFLHAGILHALGNLYFLLTFGDNVEDYLGRERYLLLLIGATLLGSLAHLAADPSSTVPCIGASGGISGIVAFYALKFPHVRLGFMAWLFPFFRWIRFRAVWGFAFWVLLQALGAWQQLAGFTQVSALAHLGGAAAGVACWLVFRHR